MRVLVVNPPSSAESNLDRIRADDLEIFRCRQPEEAIAILKESKIDLVFVFLKLLDRVTFSTLLSIFSEYPDLKVIGLADADTSDFLSFLEQVDLTLVEAGAVD